MNIVDKNPDGTDASCVTLSQRKAVVVLEADTQDMLRTAEAGHMAIEFASGKGLVGAAIRTEGSVYAVDKTGNPADPLTSLATNARFRIEFTLGSTV
jgi:hypothetical protein